MSARQAVAMTEQQSGAIAARVTQEMREIDVTDCPVDSDVFARRWVRTVKPVLMRNAIGDWAAMSKWTAEYLRHTIGSCRVNVAASESNYFWETGAASMTVAEFLSLVANPTRSGPRLYLQGCSMAQFPSLQRDMHTPAFVEPVIAGARDGGGGGTQLWIGPQGSTSGLHYDGSHSLICQVAGEKRVVLFAPSDFGALRPKSAWDRCPNHSQVSIDSSAAATLPATPFATVVQAGEALLIPRFWWHQVCSTGTLNVSVHYRWLDSVAPRYYELIRYPSILVAWAHTLPLVAVMQAKHRWTRARDAYKRARDDRA